MYSTLKLNLKQIESLTKNVYDNLRVNTKNIGIKVSKRMFSDTESKYNLPIQTRENKTNSNNSVNELEKLLKR